MQDHCDTVHFNVEEAQHITGQEPKPYRLIPILKLFMNVHYGSWLAMVLVVGIFHGFIDGTLPWHLDHMRECNVKTFNMWVSNLAI